MKCSNCGGEEFYEARFEKGGDVLVCFKCRARYPLKGSEQEKEAEG